MAKFLKLFSFLFLASSLALFGCGGGGGGGDDDPQDATPLADAGNDVKVLADAGAVILDGSASSDPEGADLTYTWTPPPGTTLSGAGPNPQLLFSSPGIYPVSLVVNDGTMSSSTDVVTVTAYDTIPDSAIRTLGQSALAMEGEENGGFYILGTVAESEGSTLTDMYIQKTDPDGTTLSQKRLGFPNSLDFPADLVVLGAGRVAVVGTTEEDTDPETNAPGDIYLAVVDLSSSGEGTLVYDPIVLSRPGDDLVASLRRTDDGGLLISGSSVKEETTQVMRFVRFGAGIETATQTAPAWDIFVDAPEGVDYGIDALEASPGEVIVLGDTLSADQDFMYLARVNTGDPLNPETLNLIGGPGAEVSLGLEKTTSGYFIVGSSNSFGHGGYDILAIPTGPDGQYTGQLSDYAIGGGRDDFSVYARKVIQAPSGFLITGVTQPVENDFDTVLLTFTSDGNQENIGVYAFEGLSDEVGLFARQTSAATYELAGVSGNLAFGNPAEFNVTAGDFFTVGLDSSLRVIE